MGKSRNKNHNSELQALRSENRRLKKLLKQAGRGPVESEEKEPEPVVVETKAICPDCGKGEIKHVLNIGVRDIFECTVCDYRKVVRNETS